MSLLKILIGVVCISSFCSAQVPEVRPQIVGRAVQEGQVAVVYLAPRFATAIRMPDAVNSVVVGDPDSFTAEHSEREPRIVFVKPITEKAAQTNLIITTIRGYQANLLLISRGDPAGTQPNIDFMMRYRPAARFIIDQSSPSVSVAQTAVLPTPEQNKQPPATPSPAGQPKIASSMDANRSIAQRASLSLALDPPANDGPAAVVEPHGDSASDLDALLERQRRAPLPALYGERPGVAPPGKQILKAGVSEVIDEGKEVVVLFSVLNMQDHAVELMPPQVQLGGSVKKGKIVHHPVWSNSEQLPVEGFRMTARRIGPGERADGVLVFQRPSFKQSDETLLLQMADSGAVDRPALAPIGFGISSLRQEGDE
jgi:hypothetical protein